MGSDSSKCCCAETNGKDDIMIHIGQQASITEHRKDNNTGHKYDLFLSHKQSEAQDAVATLSFNLKQARSEIRLWLDLEQDPTEQAGLKLR